MHSHHLKSFWVIVSTQACSGMFGVLGVNNTGHRSYLYLIVSPKVETVLDLFSFLFFSVRTTATGHILRHGGFQSLVFWVDISCILWMEWGFKPLLRLELPHYDLLSLLTAANSCFLSISLYLFLFRFLSLSVNDFYALLKHVGALRERI